MKKERECNCEQYMIHGLCPHVGYVGATNTPPLKSKYSIKQRRARAFKIGYMKGRKEGVLLGFSCCYLTLAFLLMLFHFAPGL